MTRIHKLEAALILAMLALSLCADLGWARDHFRMLTAEAVAQERQKSVDLSEFQVQAYADQIEQLTLALRDRREFTAVPQPCPRKAPHEHPVRHRHRPHQL